MNEQRFKLEAKISPAKKRKDQAWVTRMLSRIKTFEDWVAGMSESERSDLERLYSRKPQLWGGGTLRGFYEKFVAQIQEIQRDSAPTTYVLTELGRKGGKASAKALTPAQRTARARKAGKARQAKARRERAQQVPKSNDRWSQPQSTQQIHWIQEIRVRILIIAVNHQIQPAQIKSMSTNGSLEAFERDQKEKFGELLREQIRGRGVQFVGEEARHGEESVAQRVCQQAGLRPVTNIDMTPAQRQVHNIPPGYYIVAQYCPGR
jgi:hypothetical protein